MVTEFWAPGVMKKKTSCQIKGEKKYIYNFQKHDELSHLADQDIQGKWGVWEPLRDKHMKLCFCATLLGRGAVRAVWGHVLKFIKNRKLNFWGIKSLCESRCLRLRGVISETLCKESWRIKGLKCCFQELSFIESTKSLHFSIIKSTSNQVFAPFSQTSLCLLTISHFPSCFLSWPGDMTRIAVYTWWPWSL